MTINQRSCMRDSYRQKKVLAIDMFGSLSTFVYRRLKIASRRGFPTVSNGYLSFCRRVCQNAVSSTGNVARGRIMRTSDLVLVNITTYGSGQRMLFIIIPMEI